MNNFNPDSNSKLINNLIRCVVLKNLDSDIELKPKIEEMIKDCQQLMIFIKDSCFFSKNEDIDTIHEEKIKYLLVPFIWAFLLYNSPNQSKNHYENRLDRVTATLESYKHYLQLVKSYDFKILANYLDESNVLKFERLFYQSYSMFNGQASLDSKRLNKINNFKNYQMTKKDIENVEKLNLDYFENYMDRKPFALKIVHFFIQCAYQEIDSLIDEMMILNNIPNANEHLVSSSIQKPNIPTAIKIESSKQFKNKIDIKNKVFGIGYPSQSIYSTAEHVDNMINLGIFPDSEKMEADKLNVIISNKYLQQRNEVLFDCGNHSDDDISDKKLEKQRKWDDYKDTHKRGWGNTYRQG
ncbi:CD79a-binding protein 1 [Intoshia linei]|uniref:CD79a-binding protein 1 n=1 Tax=Intoshia linei TaxID=1819745 RepID=A0A177AZV8_9BILA|nr:CD79a-binding protein 1 [Intoshia linei]